MKDKHLSIRVPERLHHRLAERAGEGARSALVLRLIEEGLRMEDHPGIIFRSGPAGRRAGLIAGPDIWEVARLLRDLDLQGEELICRTSELMTLELHKVRIAARYYGAYRAEIDAWIDEFDREADEAYEAWLAASR